MSRLTARHCKTGQRINLATKRSLRLEELIAAADRDSARNMQMTTRSYMPAVLTVLVTTGFFGTLAALFNMPELKESAPMMIMLGQLSAALAACIAFWLGTTSNSQNKTNIIAHSAPVR
jgi:hypothetical protein